MRINKYIASRLSVSRRKADEIVLQGRVTCNQQIVNAGFDVTESDKVFVDGRLLPDKPNLQYIMLNKPVGYVCSHDGQGSPTVYELLPESYKSLNTVGRLDKDSSGLLLLTNDGALHNKLTHPSYKKSKIYNIKLDKPLSSKDLSQIQKGVMLDDGLSALQLTQIDNTHMQWTISMHEGRNRQIRRTFEALSYRVTHLHRTHFGPYALEVLDLGDYSIIIM